MKKIARQLIDDKTLIGGRFENVINLLIIISIFGFSLETLPNLPSNLVQLLNYIELICVIFFSFEFIIRILYTGKPLNYLFSFYGIVDLLAILPFYLTLGFDLRSLRIIRLLRLLRLLKLFAYSDSFEIFKESFKKIKAELILFSFISIIFLYISSLGIYLFENEAQPENFKSIFHSLWWSIATLTTVGYGDIYPITIGGKIFSGFVIFMGIGLIAVPTGLIASSLTSILKEKNEN